MDSFPDANSMPAKSEPMRLDCQLALVLALVCDDANTRLVALVDL